MATIFIDGFDKYGPPIDTAFAPSGPPPLAQGKWTLLGSFVPEIMPGLSATGYAVNYQVGSTGLAQMVRTLPANYTRLIGGIRFNVSLFGDAGIYFVDNSTPQCSIIIENTSGFIAVKEGLNGTTLALSSASVAGNTTHYLEWDITFNSNPTLGGWTVWLDGVQILSGVGTTQQSGNNYANLVGIYGGNALSGNPVTFDDMYNFDATSAFNNSALLSNPAVVTQFPISDQQTQFTNNGNVFGNIYSLSQVVYSSVVNTLYLAAFKPNVNCTANDIVIQPGSTVNTANFKGVIYADGGGVPAGLLSSGTQVTGTIAGTQLTLPLVTPQSLTAGTQYWIGYICDSAVNLIDFGSANLGYSAGNTYSSGAPSTAPAMTSGQSSIVLYATCTGASTNWESEALNPPIGDISSVSSATVSTTDLYNFPALPSSVTTVYTVGVSGNCRLSAPGTHTFDLLADSSGTATGGSNTNIAPTTSYAWYDTYFDADPHTSSAWVPANVSNAYYGMLVTA